ncbi:MAG: DUF2178 domain-containing protein [Methanosarcinales archaeon]|nr:MAG: DUF2178 domain-containing protein [Methanosarcinales archaeon]
MKIRTNKKILLTICLGSILLGVLAFQFRIYYGALFCGGVFMAVIIALSAATSKRRTEFVVDERVTKIKGKASLNALVMVLLSVTVLFWVDKIWSLDLELSSLYYATLSVVIFSYGISFWYYRRMGEVV